MISVFEEVMKFPSPPLLDHCKFPVPTKSAVAPLVVITAPSQKVLGAPAVTTGFLSIAIVMVSVTGTTQAPFASAVIVKDINPLLISKALGVTKGFSVVSLSIIVPVVEV